MSVSVPTLREGRRGCGFREPGGLYMVSDGPGEDCPKLPIALTVCPTCGGGIKPTRGFTWIEPNALVKPEPHGSEDHSLRCPLASPFDYKAGLVWIGDKFYSTASFAAEAERMGISRRIPAVPKDFEIGKTWVFCAHRKALTKPCPECADKPPEPECPICDGVGSTYVAAIFYLFRPQRVEYVVKGNETDDQLERLVKRGIRPVKVEPIDAQTSLAVPHAE